MFAYRHVMMRKKISLRRTPGKRAQAACEMSELLECGGKKITIQMSKPKKDGSGSKPRVHFALRHLCRAMSNGTSRCTESYHCTK